MDIEFIVDTGSDGDLTLPLFLLRRTTAAPAFTTVRTMADGSVRECNAFLLDLLSNGEARMIEILQFEHNPLLGTNLIEGCSLRVQLDAGGEVVIEFPD